VEPVAKLKGAEAHTYGSDNSVRFGHFERYHTNSTQKNTAGNTSTHLRNSDILKDTILIYGDYSRYTEVRTPYYSMQYAVGNLNQIVVRGRIRIKQNKKL